MSRETLLARLRNALASRLARSRWGRHRSSEPAAPPVPIVVPVELPLPPPPMPTAMETPPAHPPQIEILVPRAPGRFETDAELGMHPKLYDAPHKRREFVVYLPAGWSKDVQAPLIVLCHGCKQTPEDFAKGTRITDLADRLGCLVLMPRQTKWANPWRCWNWYDPLITAKGGEAEIIAAHIRFVRQRYRADPRRVMAVGISAGAALAAALGLRYPRHVHAVVTHAGIAYGAAPSALLASDVMLRGPQADVEAIGGRARGKFGGVLPVPLLAIHGDSDAVVSPANSVALVRQYLHFNGHPAVSGDTEAAAPPGEMPNADSMATVAGEDGRDVTTQEWRIGGRLVVRHVAIAGLGHAWSGGDSTLAFNDPRPPDSSQLVGDFLADVLPGGGVST